MNPFRQIFILFLLFFSIKNFGQKTLSDPKYSENFNTLLKTGVGNSLPDGWRLDETGTNANGNYTAGNGAGNSGDSYSFGTTDSDERALGCLQSGSLIPAIGFGFTNSTGSNITSLKISYTGEQWRLGTTGRADRLDFQYSTDATSLSTGTWKDVDSLDFSSPTTTGTVGALDGNAEANTRKISFTITGLLIEAGKTVYLRWRDFNASGADDGLAIDDFLLEAGGADGSGALPTITALSPAHQQTGVGLQLRCKISFSQPVVKGSGSISLFKSSDNAKVADLSAAQVQVSGANAEFTLSGLSVSTSYYLQVPAGLFTDAGGRPLPAAGGPNGWSFSTNAWPLYNYDLNTCDLGNPGSWKQSSVKGDSTWRCAPDAWLNSGGFRINGFSSSTGAQIQDDWLISPAMDLSLYNIPTLNFRLRSRFKGAPLRVYYAIGTDSTAPAAGSAAWTLLETIYTIEHNDRWQSIQPLDLGAAKSAKTYLAFRYTSSPEEGSSQVTLDDIQVGNAQKAPAAYLNPLSPTLLVFDQGTPGQASAPQSFQFQVFNLSGELSLQAPAFFELSLDSSTYAATAKLSAAQAKANALKLFVRYKPTLSAAQDGGKISILAGGSAVAALQVLGNTLDPASTLDIVNWNIEWFGNPASGYGPSDDDLAERNVRTVLERLNADVYAFQEVVDVNRFRRMIGALKDYGVFIADYCSNASDTLSSNYANGQKLAFAYRKSTVSRATARGMKRNSASAYSNWASGRFPFLMEARVNTGSGEQTLHFIAIHGKSGSTLADFTRRRDAARELKDTLDAAFSKVPVIVLGDYNDDLDSTISAAEVQPAVSPYALFVADTLDADRYRSPSLVLSNAGYNSISGYADVVEHIVVSDELEKALWPGGVRLVTEVKDWIADYHNTTSDHFPLMARLRFSSLLTSEKTLPLEDRALVLLGNPVSDALRFRLSVQSSDLQFSVFSSDGRLCSQSSIANAGAFESVFEIPTQSLPAGSYWLQVRNGRYRAVRPFVVQHPGK